MANKPTLGSWNTKGTAAIPSSEMSVQGLYYAVQALKQNVEKLTGQLGDKRGGAVTFQDLIDLGLIDEIQLPDDVPRKGI